MQRNQPKSQISWLDIYPGDILWRETHGSLNPLCFKSSMVIISKLKLGFSGDFHQVGTIGEITSDLYLSLIHI